MRRNGKLFLASILTVLMISLFAGCSILGYNIGRALDNKKPDYQYSKISGLNAMHTPLGLQTRENFNRLKNQKVYITLTNNQSFSCWFSSIERKDGIEYLNFQSKDKNHPLVFKDILCIQRGREKSRWQNCDLIISTRQGGEVKGKFHSVNMENNQVHLVLNSEGSRQIIACKDILQLQSKRRKSGAKNGFLVGLVFDAAIFAALSTIDIDLDMDIPILTGSWTE